MRSKWMLCVILGMTVLACAKEPRAYQTGKLLQMDSVTCGTSEKQVNSATGEALSTDSDSKKTQEVLCQEYVL